MLQELRFSRIKISLIFLFTLIGFIIYLPVLGNGFLSDDYDSLYRIYIQKRILYREFLRPMIDLSFYLNYLVSGLSPRSYYVFNITIHIINAILVFRFASGYTLFTKKNQFVFAVISGFLFLIYPFHNESIAWLSGRLSSMACLFALICLIIANESTSKKSTFISGFIYFVGLLCYESIIFLPAIIIILTWTKERSVKKLFTAGLFWLTTTALYLITRFVLSGEINGNYGDRLIDSHIKQKILNSGKVFGRLFLPGSENQTLLVVMSCVIFFGVLYTLRIVFKNINISRDEKSNYAALVIFLIISLIIPVAFGVSTRTSEGDRLLYFPSCYLCMLIAGSVIWITKHKVYRIITFSAISIYFLCFLEKNNMQWEKASKAAYTILQSIRTQGSGNTILINTPDELEGAYVFRNGLVKALMIYKMDTSRIKIMNYLKRKDYLKAGKVIPVEILDSTLIIYPDIRIVIHDDQSLQFTNTQNNSLLNLRKDRNLVYYWNKEDLVRLF